MANQGGQSAEAMFEQALKVAEKHLSAAMQEAGPLAPYVAVAMIEAAVNVGVDAAGHADIADMLRDLAGQIENDAGNDNEEEDEDEDQ